MGNCLYSHQYFSFCTFSYVSIYNTAYHAAAFVLYYCHIVSVKSLSYLVLSLITPTDFRSAHCNPKFMCMTESVSMLRTTIRNMLCNADWFDKKQVWPCFSHWSLWESVCHTDDMPTCISAKSKLQVTNKGRRSCLFGWA